MAYGPGPALKVIIPKPLSYWRPPEVGAYALLQNLGFIGPTGHDHQQQAWLMATTLGLTSSDSLPLLDPSSLLMDTSLPLLLQWPL